MRLVYRARVKLRSLLPAADSIGGRTRYLAGIAVFVLAGGLFAASAITARGTNLRSDQVSSVRDLVQQRSEQLARAQRAVDRQRAVVERLALAADVPGLEKAQAQVAALDPVVGSTEVSGAAIRVALDDAPPEMRTNPDVDPNDLVVHQQDVQAVVNAMWRGGARGVQVMDQRIAATTAIKCVGNTLLIQGRVYSPPYVITGVGDQAGILLSLQNDPDVTVYRDYADAFGLGWAVDRLASFTLRPFSVPGRLQFATAPASATTKQPSP